MKKAKNKKVSSTSFLMCLLLGVMGASIVSCSKNDEQIVQKDYGLKTFAANYNYTNGTYMNQVYFSFSDSLTGTATQGTSNWTNFYLISDSAQYNITSNYLSNWDVVFTSYTTSLASSSGGYVAYKVTGALINSKKKIQVALIKYTNSENTDSISSAFAKLKISDVSSLDYSSNVDAIGYNWKAIDMVTYAYKVSTNHFYIVKLSDGNYYKLRFIGFYGSSTNERVAKIQYQLMQ
jgi:hypothetical protein